MRTSFVAGMMRHVRGFSRRSRRRFKRRPGSPARRYRRSAHGAESRPFPRPTAPPQSAGWVAGFLDRAPGPVAWACWAWSLTVGLAANLFLLNYSTLPGVRGIVGTIIVTVPAMALATVFNAIASVVGLGGGGTWLFGFVGFATALGAQVLGLISIPSIFEFLFGKRSLF